jgi:hypothetical protein
VASILYNGQHKSKARSGMGVLVMTWDAHYLRQLLYANQVAARPVTQTGINP